MMYRSRSTRFPDKKSFEPRGFLPPREACHRRGVGGSPQPSTLKVQGHKWGQIPQNSFDGRSILEHVIEGTTAPRPAGEASMPWPPPRIILRPPVAHCPQKEIPDAHVTIFSDVVGAQRLGPLMRPVQLSVPASRLTRATPNALLFASKLTRYEPWLVAVSPGPFFSTASCAGVPRKQTIHIRSKVDVAAAAFSSCA